MDNSSIEQTLIRIAEALEFRNKLHIADKTGDSQLVKNYLDHLEENNNG